MSDDTGEQAKGEPGAGPSGSGGGAGAPAGRFWLIPAVITLAAVLVVVVIIGMRRAEAQRAEEERKAAERAKASIPTVKVWKVARTKLMLDHVELSGTLRASRDVMVFAEVPGKLERVAVKRGREVRAGEVLAVVESDTLRAQLEQTNAALAVATAGARAARVARDNAASGRERVRGLEKTGSASEREVEGAETMLQTAEAQVTLANSQIEQTLAAVSLTKLQLEKAVITAPFAGTVADDFNHTAGAMVGPQFPVARIVEMQHLRIDLRASERDLARIRNGQKADIRVGSSPGRVFEGIVLVAGPVLDPMTRTAPVEIAVENVVEDGELLLKPGMYADVAIVVDRRENVLAVSPECLTSREGTDAVFTVRPANEVSVRFKPERVAELGITMDDILKKFSEGEIAITRAQAAEARKIRPPRIPVHSDMFDELMNVKVGPGEDVRLRDIAEMELVLDPDELRRRDLQVGGVVQALRKARVEVSEEEASEVRQKHVLRLPGESDLAEKIAEILLDKDKGVRVRDIAEIELTPHESHCHVVLRTVKLGLRTRDLVEVTEGIAEGDEIIISGVRALATGAKVRVGPAGTAGEEESR